jgi:hypothetical protein
VVATFPKNIKFSYRAGEFYSRVFGLAYGSLQDAVNHTPLVVMLWGPRQRPREWSQRRAQIRQALEQRGHTAFFSEQLGVPTDVGSKKGVEFLQSEAADLIVVMQPLYSVVGSVRHFVEGRVVDAKMLLFIDESAPDQHLYARALAELQAHYDNIDTYKFPEDVSRKTLLDKILNHVRVMQMVKYRAIQSGRNWGLGARDLTLDSTAASPAARVFPHNLLELYREHRREIDVLTRLVPLFILAFTHHVNRITAEELLREIHLAPSEIFRELEQLEAAGLLAQSDGVYEVSGKGYRLLSTLGLTAPMPKTAVTIPRRLSWQRAAVMSGAAGVALAGVILVSLAILNGANVSERKQPLEFTPVPTRNTPALTLTPTRADTLTVSPEAPATPGR